MKLLLKKFSTFVKKRCWYLILLSGSSLYVWYYKNAIYQLKELNVHNLIFLIWLLLLLLPLFSEMEFLGIKVKKEVQKATEEVKDSLKNIKMQISQLQLSNSVDISLGNSILPSEAKMEELLGTVRELQKSNSSVDLTKQADYREKDKNVYLFKTRLKIETIIRDLCEKIGYEDKMPLTRMTYLLRKGEIIDGMTCDLISQICKIANRGVHGEIVSDEYINFVRETTPKVLEILENVSRKLRFVICPKCHFTGYSLYENVCPKCGYVNCDE